jgi:hypothetical protein
VAEVEVVCSDLREHRRCAEERVLDIPGLANPSWEQIQQRGYHAWERDRLVIDTALLTSSNRCSACYKLSIDSRAAP